MSDIPSLCFSRYVLRSKDFNLVEFFGDQLEGARGDVNIPAMSAAHEAQVDLSMQRVDSKTKGQAYQAWLGYYNGFCPKRVSWSRRAFALTVTKKLLLLK